MQSTAVEQQNQQGYYFEEAMEVGTTVCQSKVKWSEDCRPI